MLKLLVIARTRAYFLAAIAAVSCCFVAPANAAGAGTSAGVSGSPVPRASAVAPGVGRDRQAMNMRALFRSRKLRLWLRHGQRPRLHLRHVFGSPLQHAFRFGTDRGAHR